MNHQGVVADVASVERYVQVEDILDRAEKMNQKPLIGFLDGVQDPHNLGAIIRSADGAGLHGLVIPKDNSVGLTPAVFKASAGAAAHVPVARVTNMVQTMKKLKKMGLWFVGTDHTAEKSYYEMDLAMPIGIVLGSEGQGVRRLVRENCDFLASIPMHGQVNSLNVSVAAALFFFQASQQRQK